MSVSCQLLQLWLYSTQLLDQVRVWLNYWKQQQSRTWLAGMHRTYLCFWESFIHSIACAKCDDSLPFSGASLIPLCYIPFPSTLFDQLVFHPSSLHLAIYFLVYLSALLLPNSYTILFGNSIPISFLQLFPAFSPVYYILISCLQLFCTLSLYASDCLLHSDLILTAVSYIFSLCLQLFITFWSHASCCLLRSSHMLTAFFTFQSHSYSCLLHSGHMLPAVYYVPVTFLQLCLHSSHILTAVYYILVTCFQLFITFQSHAYSCFFLHSSHILTAVYYIPVTFLQLSITFRSHAYSCLLHSGHTITAVYYIPVTCLQLFITFWPHTAVYYILVTRLQLFITFQPHAYSCFIHLPLMLLAVSCIRSSNSLSNKWLHSSFEIWDR